MEEKITKLTNTAYRLLNLFPENEPLKNRAKEKVLSITDSLILVSGTEGWASLQKEKIQLKLLEDIDILLNYLEIGKVQGWISPFNFLIICNEYEKIKKEIKPSASLNRWVDLTDKPRKTEPSPGLTPRQKEILHFLKERERAQVMDLKTVLPDVTKRTIRRDLDELLKKGNISRMGEFNQVFYKIAKTQGQPDN